MPACAGGCAENGARFEVRCWIATAPLSVRLGRERDVHVRVHVYGGKSGEAVVEAVDGQAVGDRAVFAGAAGVVGIFGFEAWVLGD